MLSSARPKSAMRTVIAAFSLSAVLAAAGCTGTDSAGGSGDSGDSATVTIGFALSQSGPMAPFDVEPGNAALMRVAQLNAQGGIGGRQIKAIVKDVRSDPDTVGTVATELVSEGVNLLVTPCDFDLSAPGASVAQAASIPAISICAGDPKMADTKTLGDYIFSGNTGSDVEGATGAAWAIQRGWKSAYVIQDESIEYTKSAGKYFRAEFEKQGGTIVGEDAFPGGDNVDISNQANRLRNLSPKPDFVYVASWNPGGATAIRQLRDAGVTAPIVGPAALDGQVLLGIVGNRASNIYYTAFACYSYCSGSGRNGLDSFVSDYEKQYGAKPASSYALLGYNLISAVGSLLDGVGPGSGEQIKTALENSKPVTTPIGDVTYFSPTCHKITNMPLTVIGVEQGSMKFVGQQRVDAIPNVGDGNSCAS